MRKHPTTLTLKGNVNMYIYYVYAYLRNKDSATAKAGTPYYIGKGKGIRAFESHRHIAVPKDKNNIVFLETNLSELGALALERRIISWYGRKDLATGILLNRTDGGDGVTNMSLAARTKISIAASNQIRTIETRLKCSQTSKGRPKTIEQNKKNSDANKGISKSKIKCPHCDKIGAPANMSRWHFDNCRTVKLFG